MSSPLASPRGGESTARVPIKFGMCNTRLEVIFYRTRRMELVVQVLFFLFAVLFLRFVHG